MGPGRPENLDPAGGHSPGRYKSFLETRTGPAPGPYRVLSIVFQLKRSQRLEVSLALSLALRCSVLLGDKNGLNPFQVQFKGASTGSATAGSRRRGTHLGRVWGGHDRIIFHTRRDRTGRNGRLVDWGRAGPGRALVIRPVRCSTRDYSVYVPLIG